MGGAATYAPEVPSASFWGLQIATGQTSGSVLQSIWFPFLCGSKLPKRLVLGGNKVILDTILVEGTDEIQF